MRTVVNDGVELAYEIDGPADGEPVAFVEGLGYGRWMWRWQREALADDYRVLLPDNRGTGDSDAPEGPYTIPMLAADLDAVLADAGVEHCHLVGASMGGMIAQQYALDFDRAATLTLCCTTPGGEAAVPVPEETRAIMYSTPEGADERETIRHRMAPALSDGFAAENEDLIEQIVDWRLASDAPDHAREAQGAAVAAFDVADRLASCTVPAQILHGSDDRVVPVDNAELLDELLPNSRLAVLDGGPHLFFVESPTWVNDRLRSFLESHSLAISEG